jgi:hypothetical protein
LFYQGALEVEQTYETRYMVAAVNRLTPEISRIIPGDWGKVESGWLARPLGKRFARAVDGGRIHQSLWRRSRAARNAMQGLRSEER